MKLSEVLILAKKDLSLGISYTYYRKPDWSWGFCSSLFQDKHGIVGKTSHEMIYDDMKDILSMPPNEGTR